MKDDECGLKKRINELENELKIKNMALENSPSLMFVTDAQNRIKEVYGTKKELLLKEHDILNKKFSDILPKDAAMKINKAIKDAKETKKVTRTEYELDIKGRIQHYSIRVNHGSDDHYVHTVNNITTKKKSAHALKQSEERFKTLFKTTPVGMIIHDKDTGEILSANPAGCKLYKYTTPEEFKENNMWLNNEYSFEEALKKIKKTVDEGPQRFEWKNRKKTGETFWEDVYLNTINIAGKDRVLASSIDITDKKELEQEREKTLDALKKANATKEKMFSIIGHDLKNPFNSILGFTQILSNDYEDLNDCERKKYLDIAHNSAKNAYNLLESLLEWSLASQRKQRYEPKNLDLREIVTEINELNENYIKQNEINFSNRILPNTYAEADKDMISTSFRNLISNAIKYTDKHGKIIIDAEESEREYKISIKDTGIGMGDETKKRLFELTNTSSTKGIRGEIGTGLGFDLANRFIQKHNGKINVESAKGQGTSIYVTLPKKQIY